MKEFNNIEEMKEFYDEDKNLFYIEDNINIQFDLFCDWNITAKNIIAKNITVWDINAKDITAENINARDINYFAVCCAYKEIKCEHIDGHRAHCKHFALDGKIIIKGEK